MLQDAGKPNLDLINIKGKKPTQQKTEIAKNYLNEKELNLLNRMVTAYLGIAKLERKEIKSKINLMLKHSNLFLKDKT